MTGEYAGTCPYCDGDTKHLNNHIRMSAAEHGPQGQYPEDWDRDDRQRTEQQPAEQVEQVEPSDGPTGPTVDGLGDDLGDDPEQEATPLDLSDDPSEAREYDCSSCGDPVEYLSDCENCGNGLQWGAA